MSTKIPLIMLPRALAPYGVTVSYGQAWQAATAGRIPAERVRRAWMIDPADLPAIAQSLTVTR